MSVRRTPHPEQGPEGCNDLDALATIILIVGGSASGSLVSARRNRLVLRRRRSSGPRDRAAGRARGRDLHRLMWASITLATIVAGYDLSGPNHLRLPDVDARADGLQG